MLLFKVGLLTLIKMESLMFLAKLNFNFSLIFHNLVYFNLIYSNNTLCALHFDLQANLT